MNISFLFYVILCICAVKIGLSTSQADSVSAVSVAKFSLKSQDNNRESCLPKSQKLKRIKSVDSMGNDAEASIDVKADTQNNCIIVRSTIKDKVVCRKIPEVSGFTLEFQDKCLRIPTLLDLVVFYEYYVVNVDTPTN